uniref:Uncharacterized protein n=1 Tax=Parascaris equorum TaxID=6256 RepID=A0A914REM4_PAREQ
DPRYLRPASDILEIPIGRYAQLTKFVTLVLLVLILMWNCLDPSFSETDENALLDFDTTSLIREMESYQKGDMVMERAREVLARSDFTFKDKIKSRVKGTL